MAEKKNDKLSRGTAMVHFVGAGSGAADLITVRGQSLLSKADVIIYAGSIINKELLNICKKNAKLYGKVWGS